MARPVHPFTVSHRDILAIALPASVAFITVPLVGIVDIAIIGRLGSAALLGGIELGAVSFSLLFATAYFLRLGTAGLVAQSVGANTPDGGLSHLIRAALVGTGLGLVMLVLTPFIKMAGLALFAPPTSAVQDAYLTYLGVRIWSAPFVLLNFAFLGWFYGHGAAKTGMLIQIFLNLANIGFSIWFVYGLNLSVAGVAAGTLVAEILAFVVALVVIFWQTRHERKARTVSLNQLLDNKALWRLFDLSRDLMIRSLVLSSCFAFFSAQMSRTGEIALASSAILLNFMMVTAFFLDGQAQAAEFYCGKAVGANYKPAFMQSWHLAAFWGLVVGFALFMFWLLAGPYLVDLLTTNPDVRKAAKAQLFVASLISFTGVLAFVMDGVTTGATLNVLVRNGMVASSIIFVFAAILLEKTFGLTGLWISLHVFFIVRGAIFWFGVKAKLNTLFS
ncbi:MAG TPA: MATE family efflux transporter [Devosia sp.]|nr:MATE family efflux transporter [Devosia sp.]